MNAREARNISESAADSPVERAYEEALERIEEFAEQGYFEARISIKGKVYREVQRRLLLNCYNITVISAGDSISDFYVLVTW